MLYIIYKITNIKNNKYYIGKHKTNNLDDGYMGSGKLLKKAVKKYGKESFVKEILHIFESEQQMNDKEKELVIVSENTYNLCEGGKGGFSYINNEGLAFGGNPKRWSDKGRQSFLKRLENDLKFKEYYKQMFLEKLPHIHSVIKQKYPNGTQSMLGKKHTEETKQKMRKSKNVKDKNSQYGTCWITNGQEDKKIKKTELDTWLRQGYTKGRKVNCN